MKKCMIVLAGFILLLAGCPRIEGGGKPSSTVTEYKVIFSHTPKEGGSLTAKIKDGGAFISGAKAAENTVLEFTAEPTSNYSIQSWSGEGLTVSADKKSATLKVSKAVNVTVTFAKNGTPTPPPTGKEYKVTFLHTPDKGGSLTAKIKGGGAFISGAKAAENTVLEFTAEPASNYSVGKWSGEGLTVSADKKSATLKVSKEVNVTVTFVTNGTPPPPTAQEYTVTFNSQGGAPTPESKKVKHGQMIEKPADPAKPDYTFGGWYINGSSVPWDFAKDTVTGNITLRAYWKSKPVTITFDSSKIECVKNGTTKVTANSTVYENDYLVFTAILSEGQIVEKWKFNTLAILTSESSYHYPIIAEDVLQGTLNVDYAVKTAAKKTVHFDSSKMRCWKVSDPKTFSGTPVTNGAAVYENDLLMCIAQPAAGKMADLWKVGDSSAEGRAGKGNFFGYVVTKDSNVQFSYTEKDAETLTLEFDSSKIQCTKLFDSVPITPGTLTEGDPLVFKAKNGFKVMWYINGKKYHDGQDVPVFFTKDILKLTGGNRVQISYEQVDG